MLLLLTVLTLALQDPGAPAMPRIGQPAPAFAFSAVVPTDAPSSSPADLTPEKLKGKVVVLDFFATWCAPCVASIPHTNDLIARVADLPVVFLAVTDQDAAAFDEFLKDHPMRATLVLDRDRQTYTNYFIASLPFVAIVGPDGRIAAFEHPARLSREVLEKALARGSGVRGDRPLIPDRPGPGSPTRAGG